MTKYSIGLFFSGLFNLCGGTAWLWGGLLLIWLWYMFLKNENQTNYRHKWNKDIEDSVFLVCVIGGILYLIYLTATIWNAIPDGGAQ